MSPARKKTTAKAASRKTSARGKTAGRKKASRGAPKKKKTATRKKKAGATRKTAKKKSVTKKAATKKTAKKAATRKGAAKTIAKKQAPPAPPATPEKRTRRKSAAARAADPVKAGAAKPQTPARPAVPPPDAHPKLGVKHTCYRCNAKFYDLFRPEPLCPKCGADQREAPKLPPRPKPMPVRKTPAKRAMTPLLDEEDEELLFDDDREPGLDLEAAGAELDDPTDLNDEDLDV